MGTICEGLQPKGFFRWFEEICRIPHGSGKEKEIADFIEDFAIERKIECSRDSCNNILMRLKASAGYEEEAPILLQAHMDMVWARTTESKINFETDPIELVLDGNVLHANGTTLGADDGVGIATMLAIADDSSLEHPMLELLFTVKEEIGLVGMKEFDATQILSHRMINFDCGSSHRMCVSSAGSNKLLIEKVYECETVSDGVLLKCLINGGLGGHGGEMIHMNRACAINLMSELNYYLQKIIAVQMVSIKAEGPAIHGSCEAEFYVPTFAVQLAQETLSQKWNIINARYTQSDPDLSMTVYPVAEKHEALSNEASSELIQMLFLLNSGVRKSDEKNLKIIVASSCVNSAKLFAGNLSVVYSVRSFDDSVTELWTERTAVILKLLHFDWKMDNSYPGWPSRPDSEMQRRCSKAHEELFGTMIEKEYVHGGIEVSILFGDIPDMDAIGIMPASSDYHTPEEKLFVDGVEPFWNIVKSILMEKGN